MSSPAHPFLFVATTLVIVITLAFSSSGADFTLFELLFLFDLQLEPASECRLIVLPLGRCFNFINQVVSGRSHRSKQFN
jgi:hypothetical protein